MPDIFLSYNREDQAVARRFAEAFQAEGFDVWWDTTLRAGEAYDEVTEAALNDAKAVVVLWSPRSAASRWVRAEATQADRNKTLVPVTIEACKRPIMFELTQTADLCGWDGDARSGAWLAFLGDVKRFVGAGRPGPQPAPPSLAGPQTAGRLSICVLPFANMSRDDDQEYFADGISEDIITDLSKVSALSVIARNTAFTFKGKSVEAPLVARQLKVTHLLEGSVRKAGNRVRITAQLIDGEAGDHVWADRWDRDLDDIFALQDEVSQAIVRALKLKLLPEEKKSIEDRGTTNLEAYDAYLRARALLNAASTVTALYGVRDACRRVLAIDPDFTSARSLMAMVYLYLENFAPENLADFRKERDALANETIAHAPDHWSSHLLNAVRLADTRQWLPTLAAAKRAIDLAPASETAARYFLAMYFGDVGRIGDWISTGEAVRATDPLSTSVSPSLQMAYFVAGRKEEARAEYERTLDLPGLREIPEHTRLFREWDNGNLEKTKALFRHYLDSQTVKSAFLAECCEVIDQPGAAVAVLRRAIEEPANQDATRMMVIAIHAGLYGDDDLAVRALRRSMVEFDFYAKFILWWPSLRRARQTPAFAQLIRDLGIYDYWRASGNWGDFAKPVGDDDFETIR